MKGMKENEALWKDEKGKQEGGGFGGNKSGGRFNSKPGRFNNNRGLRTPRR